MKKITISIISMILITASANAQNTLLDISYMECGYKFTLMADTIKNIKTIKDQHMMLLIGNKYSKFYSYTTFFSDSLRTSMSAIERENMLSTNNAAGMVEFLQKNPLGELYNIYKNYTENTITFTDRLPSRVLYSEPMVKQDWKIINETKEIVGYNCQKATCTFRGRDYVAWFTREIPVNEGPWKFSGLPGLIIKVCDTQERYDFELYAVRKVKKDIVFSKEEGSDYQKISRKEYLKMSRNYIQNPFANIDVTFRRADGTPFIPDQKRYDVMERDIK
ncbi:MAG: GLPGLI family protein [Prevotellaceae bacterium]|jgi:GLPGLI family protein|nr:GLPGLI family protein [Prevotellaceae bacterium]